MDGLGFKFGNLCIDTCFFLDILITFRSAYVDDFGQEIVDGKVIAWNYIKGQFWIDLFATIPLDAMV